MIDCPKVKVSICAVKMVPGIVGEHDQGCGHQDVGQTVTNDCLGRGPWAGLFCPGHLRGGGHYI